MKDKNNQSRRFGFVEIQEGTVTNQIEAEELLGVSPFEAHIVDGKQVDCKLAVPKDPQQLKKRADQKRKKRREKRDRKKR